MTGQAVNGPEGETQGIIYLRGTDLELIPMAPDGLLSDPVRANGIRPDDARTSTPKCHFTGMDSRRKRAATAQLSAFGVCRRRCVSSHAKGWLMPTPTLRLMNKSRT